MNNDNNDDGPPPPEPPPSVDKVRITLLRPPMSRTDMIAVSPSTTTLVDLSALQR